MVGQVDFARIFSDGYFSMKKGCGRPLIPYELLENQISFFVVFWGYLEGACIIIPPLKPLGLSILIPSIYQPLFSHVFNILSSFQLFFCLLHLSAE